LRLFLEHARKRTRQRVRTLPVEIAAGASRILPRDLAACKYDQERGGARRIDAFDGRVERGILMPAACAEPVVDLALRPASTEPLPVKRAG
jgi:hypothetical protein